MTDRLARTALRSHIVHAMRITAAAVTLLLASCGGDVDSGGTGSPVYASGTITGFGSVVVGGVHFDDARATVLDGDGSVRSRDDLRLGMTTEVRGSAISTDATGTSSSTASSIAFSSDLLGRVGSIDSANARLVVLGQTVDITAGTVFDDASLSGGLAALSVGDIVEVYALFDAASGRHAATRIERKSIAANVILRGVVSQLDTAARAFSIGSERISYAAFSGTPPAALANGSVVRVRLNPVQVAGVWQVSALADGVRRLPDQDEVRLEGLVTAFVSARQFSVDGVAVDASASTASGVALGVRVEVKGTARAGVLVASEVSVKGGGGNDAGEFELRGAVTSSDPAQLSFVVRGVSVVYSTTTTEFRNGTAAGIVAGANVEARGPLSPDGTRLLATRITFR
jgi:hypothetical protein